MLPPQHHDVKRLFGHFEEGDAPIHARLAGPAMRLPCQRADDLATARVFDAARFAVPAVRLALAFAERAVVRELVATLRAVSSTASVAASATRRTFWAVERVTEEPVGRVVGCVPPVTRAARSRTAVTVPCATPLI